jgi:hypothetical protein
MYASPSVLGTRRRSERKISQDPLFRQWRIGDPSHGRVPVVEFEPIRSDPKDGELCSSRMKPEETLVEVRSDSDVQIDRLT